MNNINELKELIKAGLAADKSFRLDTKKLSGNLAELGADYLAASSLKLSNTSIFTENNESITIKGTGVDLPFKSLAIEAEFYMAGENAALFMKASTGSDWTFEKSVPAFEGTIFNKIKFTQTPLPAFYLLSHDKDEKPRGLTFQGTINFDIMPGGLKELLGLTETISGPLVLEKEASKLVSIDFKGPDIGHVNIGIIDDFTVTFGISSNTYGDAGNSTRVIVPCININTQIPFKGLHGKAYAIPLSVKLRDFSSVIRFNAELEQVIDASLDAVAALAGGINLTTALPADFSIADYVELANLYIDYDPGKKKVAVVGLEVRQKEPGWEILKIDSTGETFDAKNISLQFSVFDPSNKENRKVALYLGGDVTLTDTAALSINAVYPDFAVDGALADGNVLSIKDFIKKFAGKSASVPDLLDVDELYFDTDGSSYSFDLDVTGEWLINGEQSFELSIDELNLSLAYDADTDIKTADFSGSFTIEPVTLSVTASYKEEDETLLLTNDEEEGKGWIFTGSTGEGQQIPMGKFIAYLAKVFKAGDVPNWVNGVSLQDLHTQFNTITKDFEFGVTGRIPLGDDKELKIVVDFSLTAEEKGYQRELSGELTIANSIFTLKKSSGVKNEFSASWTAVKENYLRFGDLVSAFGLGSLPTIPDGLDITLASASLHYNFDDKTLIFSAATSGHGTAVFAAKKIKDKWTYVFGANIKAEVNLEQLPLVGPDLKSVAGDIGLKGFKVIGLSADMDLKEIEIFNKLIKHEDEGENIYPKLPESEKKLSRAVYVVVELDLGKDNDYQFEFNTAKKQQLALLQADKDAEDDGTKWINLEKNIGPVHFKRAGVRYKDKRVSLVLDAALVFSVLKIEMLSLGVSNPLTEVKPEFELSGINISYESGPVSISGGFLKSVVGNDVMYSGTAVIGMQNFRLSALGSYASVSGKPSLFIFAMLNSPAPGGPPCFFVTGLAGGFGYNRGLRLPSIDNVADFPLVKAFVPGVKEEDKPFKNSDPNEALKVLRDKDIVPIAIGENWLAAGVQFSSCQLVQSYALLSVAFGTNVEVGIIGVSAVSIPPATAASKPTDTPVAYAQLALNARILPEKGVVSVEAKLTPASYILSKKCVLAGGFAFYLWTAPNEHEGDFVITLGGYHPDFKVPEHYPKVPRLSFNWEVSKEVLVKGGMYFAVTPTCLMAGGSLEATFNSGNLKAWFIMGADFLIAWKPYYYTAHMYISFGVSYTFELDLAFTTITETINVSLGADLKIWGPDFSGIASIHLWIISFDISFGAADRSLPKPISWEDFKESFLPVSKKTAAHVALYGNTAVQPTDTYCYAKLTDGLVKDMQPGDPVNWIVNRDQTAFETYTICPAKEYLIKIRDKAGREIPCSVTNKDDLDGRNKNFGVGLVNVVSEEFHSVHEVFIDLDYEMPDGNHRYEVTAILRSVPKSLWEARVTGFGDEAVIKNVLVGFRIRPQALKPGRSFAIDLEDFKYHTERYKPAITFAQPGFLPPPADQSDAMGELKRSINSAEVNGVRRNILDALIKRGRKLKAKVEVGEIARHAEDHLMAAPVLSYTYWKKSA